MFQVLLKVSDNYDGNTSEQVAKKHELIAKPVNDCQAKCIKWQNGFITEYNRGLFQSKYIE